MAYRNSRSKTRKNKNKYLGKTRKNKRGGGSSSNRNRYSGYDSGNNSGNNSGYEQKYLPRQNESNQQYVNRSTKQITNNLNQLQKNPKNMNVLNSVNRHASALNGATQILSRHPDARKNMGSQNVDHLQNLGNTLLQHVGNFQKSVQRGDHDETINAAADAAKRSAVAMGKVAQDKDVQKHLANTGSTLFSMGANLFNMGHKAAQGKLSYADAIKGSLTHVALGTKAVVSSSKAGLSAYKASQK